jgi:protein TonB
LTLQDADGQLFYRYFSRREGVVLLVAPLSRHGAMFLPHRGVAHELEIEGRGEAAMAAAFKRRSKQFWPAAAAIAAGAIVGAAAMSRFESRPAWHRTQAQVPQGADRLKVRVEKSGSSVRLVWNPASSVVRSAAYAQLQITDGSHISQLKLTPVMLSAGSFEYWPQDEPVAFRMELFAVGGKVADRADAGLAGVAALPNGMGAALSAPGPLRPAAAPAPAPAQKAANRPAAGSSADRESLEDDEKPSPFSVAPAAKPVRRPAVAVKFSPPVVPAPRAAEPQPAPITTVATAASVTETKPLAPPAPPIAKPEPVKREVLEKPVVQPARPRGAHVSVDAEPLANSSKLGRAVARIPLLRRLKKQPQGYVPPRPLHEVRPALTDRESAGVVRPVPVDVKVYVGENGRVQFAELLTGSHRPELASAAVYAARKWTFSPAKDGEETVPGEVILHFRFAPTE